MEFCDVITVYILRIAAHKNIIHFVTNDVSTVSFALPIVNIMLQKI